MKYRKKKYQSGGFYMDDPIQQTHTFSTHKDTYKPHTFNFYDQDKLTSAQRYIQLKGEMHRSKHPE